MQETILRAIGNIWTTLFGVLAGMADYLTQVGVKIPETQEEFYRLIFDAFLVGIGVMAKDATTGSKPSGPAGPAALGAALFAFAMLFTSGPAFAQVLIAVDIERQSLAWDAPTTGGAVGEYSVKCGPASGNYTKITPVSPPATTLPVKDGIDGLGAWFCVVTASNQFGESGPSNEISFEAGMKPGAPGNLILRGQ